MSKFGLSTVFGLLLGIGFIVGSVVVSGHIDYFWNLPSFFITIGGTTASTIIAFPPRKLKQFFPVIFSAFKKDKTNVQEDIQKIVEISKVARVKGLLSLEEFGNDTEIDPFFREGMLLISDGITEEDLRNRMEGVMYFKKQRHMKGAAMMDMVAATAPSLGLLGTYVGLIPMLHSLDDPTTLGPMMALELVSSFYGAFIAYVIFSPLAKRLKTMSKEEETHCELLLEGLIGIVQGKNPKLIEADLLAYMNIKEEELAEKAMKSKKKAPAKAKTKSE